MTNLECRITNDDFHLIHHSTFVIHHLFTFLVRRMAAAATAELIHLKPVRRVLFVLGRHVIALFALGALQNNVISRHTSS